MKKYLIIVILLLFAQTAGAATYYVATTGNDSSADATNIATPWLTIGKCASTIVAGDTCFVRAGTYDEQVSESTDGNYGPDETPMTSDDVYITYAAYAGETVKLGGFTLTEAHYVRIIGFEMTGQSPITVTSLGIKNNGSDYNQYLYNYIHHTSSGAGILMSGSGNMADYTIVRGNRIEYPACASEGTCTGAAGINIVGDNVLVEYNSISHVGDYVGGFSSTDQIIDNNIIRNNYLGVSLQDPNWENVESPSRIYSDFPDYTNLTDYYHIDNFSVENGTKNNIAFERNYVLNGTNTTYRITEGHGIQVRQDLQHLIVRENLFANIGEYLALVDSGDYFYLYNNTVADMEYGVENGSKINNTVVLYDDDSSVTNAVARNNIFYNTNNNAGAIYATGGMAALAKDYDCHYQSGDPVESNDTNGDPLFVNYASNDYHIQTGSPCKTSGAALTLANGAAAEATTTLVVDDARFFWGQSLATKDASYTAIGDTIIIGTNDPVTVISVNYATNTLTISAAQTWADDAQIRLSHQATSPAAGAWEYKAGGYALTATWALADGTVTVTPSDASLVRFVEVSENGIPVGVDFTSPYTIAGVGAGTVTVRVFSLYASETPIITAGTEAATPSHRGVTISGGSMR